MIPGDWHLKSIRSRHAALNQGLVKERVRKDRQTDRQTVRGGGRGARKDMTG